MKTTIIDIVNSIINDASANFADRIPTATLDNIKEVANPILNHDDIRNAFLSRLINRIGATKIQQRMATNPLAIFKKGSVALGVDIQEIYVSLADGQQFDPTGANLLTRKIPDVKVIYHTMNRQGMYEQTISRPMLAQAFVSWDAFDQFVQAIINSIYSADTNDEFLLMKNLMATAFAFSDVIVSHVPVIRSQTIGAVTYAPATAQAGEDAALQLTEDIITACSNMQFMSSNFNLYSEKVPSDPKPVQTLTLREDQVLIIRVDIMTKIKTRVLAAAFHMELLDFMARVVEVDNFGAGGENVYCLLCDEAWFQVYENYFEMLEFTNPQGLWTKFILHHWQTLSNSLFVNAVCFAFDIDNAITPIATPVAGAVALGSTVALASGTTDAKIYFTTDGSIPTPRSTEYTGAISILAPVTIRAIAVKEGLEDSAVLVSTYTISGS